MNVLAILPASILVFECAAHAAPQKATPAPSPQVSATPGTIVKFRNGSVMPCTIVREEARAVVVESYGVEIELSRDEIEYYGDAAKCPGGLGVEVVTEGGREAVEPSPASPAPPSPARRPASNPSASPPAAGPAALPTPSRPRVNPPPPAASQALPAPVATVTLPSLEGNPAGYQGQRIVFHLVKLGVLQQHPGFYGLELLPPQTVKGSKHRGGTSPKMNPRGVTFVLTDSQAEDLREHSQQYDRARVEFTIEQRVVGNARYWVAPVSRLDIFRGEGSEIAWTVW